MERLIGWLKPNRIDKYVCALSLLYFLALLTPIAAAISQSLPRIPIAVLVAPYLAALICFPATMATREKIDLKRTVILLLLASASLLVFAISSRVSGNWNISPFDPIYYRASRFRFDFTTIGYGAATVPIVWSTSLVTSALFDAIFRWTRGPKFSRSRVLVTIATILFVCATVNNVLKNDFFLRFSFELPWIAGIILASAGGVLAIASLAYCFSRIRRWWLALLAVGAIQCSTGIVLAIVSTFVFNTRRFGTDDAILTTLLASITFTLVAFLIRKAPEPRCDTTNDDRAIGPQSPVANLRSRRPSIWSYSAISLLAGVAVFASLFDVSILATCVGPGRLEVARVCRQLQWKPGVATRIRFEQRWGTGTTQGRVRHFTIESRFTKHAATDYFSGFSQFPPNAVLTLQLKNINSNIDVSPIRNAKKVVEISGGQISSKQLNDLLTNSVILRIHKCKLTETEFNTSVANNNRASNLDLVEMPPGRVADYLNNLSIPARIHIYNCKLNDDDWNAIIDVIPNATIVVSNSAIPTSQATLERLNVDSISNLSFNSSYSQTNGDFWRLLLDTKLGVAFHSSSFQDKQAFWDAIFVGRGTVAGLEQMTNDVAERPSFADTIKDFHFLFGTSPTGTPQKLYLPSASPSVLSRAATFPDLELVSFDSSWIDISTTIRATSGATDLSPLSKLKKLKELYLPEETMIDDFRFLKNKQSLEILQLSTYHDTTLGSNPNFKASFTPNLKQLIIFSAPHPKLMVEISKISTLQKLTIIDSSNDFVDPAPQATLRKLLGDAVDVQFILSTEDAPDPPLVFQKHLDRVKADVRKRQLPEDSR